MNFDWRKFVDLAQRFITYEETEEVFRTAVSRSYYGVFGILRNYTGLKNYTRKDVHQRVIEALIYSQNKEERKIGRWLDELRKDRNKADYSENEKIDRNLAEKCIEIAKKILSHF